MKRTARRVVFAKKDVVDMEEFDVQQLHDDEVLIETHATLISTGTELANLAGITKAIETGQTKYPIYPGYSAAGKISAVGASVTLLKQGDRVCVPGRHATLITVRQGGAHKIPDGVSFEEATFFALGATAMNGVRIARIELGEVVAIIGMGVVGQLALQLGRLAGAGTIVAVDLSSNRLQMAEKCGADAGVNPKETDAEKRLSELTDGEMADVVIEATGNPQVFPMALKLARKGGRIVALGSPRGNVELDLYTELHCRGLALLGAHAATHPPVETPLSKWTRKRNIQLFLDLLSNRRLDVQRLITHTFPFDAAVDTFNLLVEDRTQTVGVILNYGMES